MINRRKQRNDKVHDEKKNIIVSQYSQIPVHSLTKTAWAHDEAQLALVWS